MRFLILSYKILYRKTSLGTYLRVFDKLMGNFKKYKDEIIIFLDYFVFFPKKKYYQVKKNKSKKITKLHEI